MDSSSTFFFFFPYANWPLINDLEEINLITCRWERDAEDNKLLMHMISETEYWLGILYFHVWQWCMLRYNIVSTGEIQNSR